MVTDTSPQEITSVTVVAAADDLHALTVQREVELLGYPCVIANPRDTAQCLGYLMDGSAEPVELSDHRIGGPATSVWWRRPLKAEPGEHIRNRENRRFIGAEWTAALYGYLRSTARQITNDPAAEDRANLKIVQLTAARQVGLTVPRTLVTNDPRHAGEFIAANTRTGLRTIYKPLTPPAYQLGEARVIEDLDGREDSLRQAPVILQECVERGADLRITVVDDELFAANVESDVSRLVDWRADRDVSYTRATVPDQLAQRLLALMRRLGLRTGSIDLRLGPDGTPYFFEVNPSGQFLFLELELDYPISATLARALLTLR